MLQKAYGYARVTTGEEEEGFKSLEDQSKEIDEYAKEIGFKVTMIYRDGPIEPAGKIDTSLGGIFTLLDEIRRKKVYFVIVASLDRLKIPETNVNFHAELIRINKNVLLVGQKFSFFDSMEFSDYVQENNCSDIKGRHQSGPVPYGYRKEGPVVRGQKIYIVPDENESAVVQMIFEQYEKTQSYAAVQRFLKKKRLKTRRGHEWSRAGLSWLLKNDIYLGVSKSAEDEEPQESHQSLIDRNLFEEVQGIIKKKQRKRKKKK
jgi:DNA invertase Pin-like site-specific DNA recombinase